MTIRLRTSAAKGIIIKKYSKTGAIVELRAEQRNAVIRAYCHICIVLCVVLVSRISSADSGPRPYFYELIQKGQDVKITLGIALSGADYCSGESGEKNKCTLIRENGNDEKKIFEKRYFMNEEAEDDVRKCVAYGSEEMCAEKPEECVDCDGDGTAECWTGSGGCYTFQLFYFMDRCVPPGVTTYTLFDLDYMQDEISKDIEVEDIDTSCADSCSTAAVGSYSHGVNIYLVLGAVFFSIF